jgi:hypothetical protein
MEIAMNYCFITTSLDSYYLYMNDESAIYEG